MLNLPLNVPENIDKYFYNRKNDIIIINSILNTLNEDVSQHLLITGIRGVGKTFLLKKILKEQPDNFLTVYLDISEVYSNNNGVLNAESILKQLLYLINKKLDKIVKHKKINEIKKVLKNIELNDYNFKEASSILGIAIPEFSTNYQRLSTFVMELPQKIVDSIDNINGFIIVIDEFQLLKELEKPGAFFWLIRSHTQEQSNVNYIFTGSTSNTSKITQMINGNNSAFGGRVMQINIDPFTKKETKSYFEERLPEISFTEDGFDRFYKCTRGIPAYINSFVNVLSKDVVYDDKKIKETFTVNMDQILILWLETWGTLNDSEKKIIKILVENDNLTWTKLNDKTSLSKPTLSKYLDILTNKGIIKFNEDKTYELEDKMLKVWLNYMKTKGFMI